MVVTYKYAKVYDIGPLQVVPQTFGIPVLIKGTLLIDSVNRSVAQLTVGLGSMAAILIPR